MSNHFDPILKELHETCEDESWKRVIEAFFRAELNGWMNVTIITREAIEYQAVVEALDRTLWRLSPLLTTGRPYTMGEFGHIWILTNAPLPKPDLIEEIYDKKDPANWEDVQQVHPTDAEGWKEKGYEYTGKWKGLVELTKFKQPKEPAVTVDEPSRDLGSFMEPQSDPDVTAANTLQEKIEPSNSPCLDAVNEVLDNLPPEALAELKHAAEEKAEELGITPDEVLEKAAQATTEALENADVEDTAQSLEEEDCPQEAGDPCLIERGPGFDAIKAMKVCRGCQKYSTWLTQEEVSE